MESKFVRLVGQGTYGSVALMKYTNVNGSLYYAAVKTSNAGAYESLEKEVQILSELRGCPNIVQCLGNELEQSVDETGNTVYKLYLEFAPQGSLRKFMSKYPDKKLPVAMIRVFTTMILKGLADIHRHGYVHGDLKPDNLLVFPLIDDSSSHEVKICDFGSALEDGQVPDGDTIDFPYVGTPIYLPPESFRQGFANQTLDLWSLGCLVLEMFTGQIPWKGVELCDLRTLILEGKAPEIPESLPCDAKEFIETCFSRNPEDRGTALDLLCHRFLSCQEEEEKIASSVVEQNRRDSSQLFNLKLKLRIARALKAKNVIKKRPLKLKMFPQSLHSLEVV